ncbi:hypothetical protein ABZT04_33330 [Streptomyces sp. NPDC005492]|uniref:hypothetical protein n=1 Tax=Streptomyces sp. NPDC005492 TaxID=3156883 RepID=UPI0033B99316
MAFNPFGPRVILTATVTVNGETVTAQDEVDRAAWECISKDPPYRAAYERMLRQRLAAALVDHLNPTVTVDVPEDCQPLELGSEAW